MAMESMTRGRRATPRPQERPPQSLVVDLMNPVIQAAIARQVALQRERDAVDPVPATAKGARLISFPGGG
jgi:hypothetical protein